MKRGDVVRAQLPRPAGSPGREQFGTRPAIVVQDDPTSPDLSTVVVVPLTSNIRAALFRGSFVVQPSTENGLTVDSVVLTHQIRALDKSRIEGVMGRISRADLLRLDSEIKNLLGL